MLRLLQQYYPVRNAVFVIGEAFVIFCAVMISCWFVFNPGTMVFDHRLYFKIFLISGVCQICLYYNELYDFKTGGSFAGLCIRLIQAMGFAAIILAITYFLFPGLIVGEGVSALSVGVSIVLITSWRLAYNVILERGWFNQKIIIVGSGEPALAIKAEIEVTKDCGYTVVLMVREDSVTPVPSRPGSVSPDKGYEGLCETARELKADKIIVALKEKRGAFPSRELLSCRVSGIDILEGNSFYEMLTGKLIVDQINPAWLIFSEGFKKSWILRAFKRFVDIALSFSMLIILLPLIILTAILIKTDSRGPVFFSQERVGQNRKKYMVHKFRSMGTDAEKDGPVWARKEDARVTRVGKYIRKCRVDEIPQLWNVFIGEMSFVGPRPEREYFIKKLEAIIPYYSVRFTVKPGLTGWAQVNYNYGASVEDAVAKLNYELFYLKNMSILMDLTVIVRTAKTVLLGEGAQ